LQENGKQEQAVPRGDHEKGSALMEPPFEIRIAPQGDISRNAVAFVVELTNKSKESLGWDSEWSAFLNWRLTPDAEDYLVEPVPVIRMIEQSRDSLKRTRFVKVKPGEKLRRVVVLTDSVRQLSIDAKGTPGFRHPTKLLGYECMGRYVFQNQVRNVRARLEYRCDGEISSAFENMFGFSSDAVGMWYGTTESNSVTVRFGD
jgi:hypothetical protein